jgi:predicted ester cyclase
MDTDRNKQTVRRVFEEGFTAGHLDVIDECLAPGAVDRHEFTDEEGDFRGHLKANIAMFRASFPDLRMSVQDLVAEGDKVAARVILTGTHTGAPFLGVAASRNSVSVEQFHLVQCNDAGQGIVHWAAVGVDDLMRQLVATTALSSS